LRRTLAEAATSGQSAPWKLAAAAKMKALTTVTNRWLTQQLHLGILHEVSRKVNAWIRSVAKKSKDWNSNPQTPALLVPVEK
jgi:hypothetical protein